MEANGRMGNSWDYIMDLIKENQIDRVVEICNQMEEWECRYYKDKLIREIKYTKDKRKV